jgi:hypothetical protein
MKQFLQNIEFTNRQPWAWSARLVLGVLCVGLLVVGFAMHRQQQSLDNLTARHEALKQAEHTRQPTVIAIDTDLQKTIQEQYAALQGIRRVLGQDLQVFSALELCVGQDFVFLSAKPNFEMRDLALLVETRNMEQLKQGLECLENTEMFEWVRIQSQQRVVEDVQQPIRAELQAKLVE